MKKALLISLIVAPILLGTLVLANWINWHLNRRLEAQALVEAQVRREQEAQEADKREADVNALLSKSRRNNAIREDIWLKVHCDIAKAGIMQAIVVDEIDPRTGLGKHYGLKKGDRITAVGDKGVETLDASWAVPLQTAEKLKQSLVANENEPSPLIVQRNGKEMKLVATN